jgi:hypothetical protein
MRANRAVGALPVLGQDGRRRLPQPRELCVAVWEARAGLPPFVQERMYIRKARLACGSRSLSPGERDPADLVFA